MVDAASTSDEPRRGGRARKPVEKFDASSAAKGRKRQDDGDEGEDSELSEEDSDADDPAPARKKRQSNANGTNRTGNATTPGGATKKKRKSVAANVDANGGGAAQGNGPEGMKTDSPLFNALLSADIALQPLIDDWIETYQQTEDDEVSEQASVHELVLFFLRCCGLSSDIESAEATDEDGVQDVVERIQDASGKVTAVYPLISRTKTFRAFKNNLNSFITNFIPSLSLTPMLFETAENTSYSTPLLKIILVWLNVMSSSGLRPIRHTATYIALKINSALCDVGVTAAKDLSLKQRQKEAEVKKAGPSAAAKKRVADAQAKVQEAQERKEVLEAHMQDVFDVMFVHRVRDADPAIRTDCLRELGVWAKKYPEFYVSTTFLTYFTRGCNDMDSHARLETAKALAGLYAKESFVDNARTVTIRLVPRLVEMALRDADLAVRVTAINVITLIDKTGILEDEDEGQREKIARLVYDQEPRVRKAVAGFILHLWEERKETLQREWSQARPNKKKRAAKITEEDMASRLDWKALASLLLETSQALDSTNEGSSTSKYSMILPSTATGSLTRAVAAVESLCVVYPVWKDWEKLVDYLLLDHSTSDQDIWLLTEEEETLMLQVLIAIIKSDNKDEDEEGRTKTLVKVLPRLFAKHQADSGRMAGILAIPEHMNLGLYLDMRLGAAYDALWDDVTKQFLQYTDPALLTAAIQALNQLSNNASMSTANATKLSELQEALFASLRDAIGQEDVALISLEEDQLAKLEAILLRISLLERSRDMVDVMEDEEGGQSSGWDIVCAFAERGRLGYKEEAKMIEYAVQIVFLHITWLFKRLTADDAKDDAQVASLQSKRDKAVDILHDLTLGDNNNTVDVVRRQAFIAFINLHVLFSPRTGNPAPAAKAAPLEVRDEAQHRLGGAFQAAVERYASEREAVVGADEEAATRTGDDESLSASKVQSEFLFLQLVSVFVGAIRCGVLEVDHAKEPLAHYGRFGLTYDAVVKKLVDVLRDEGIYNKEAETVQNVAGTALQQSFNIFLDTDDDEPTATIALAKLISTAFVIHGNHFSILRQIHPSDVRDFHVLALDYISRRVTHYVKQERATKNKEAKSRLQKKRFQALSYFRVIVLLLGPITSVDAAKILKNLDDSIQAIGIEITSHKSWESYRIYEKRVKSIAEKDPGVKAKLDKAKQNAQAVDVDEGAQDEGEATTPTPNRRNGRARSNTLNGGSAGERSRGRSSPLSPAPEPGPELDPDQDQDQDEEVPQSSTLQRNKRPRSQSQDDQDEGVAGQGHDGALNLDLELESDDFPHAPEMRLDMDLDIDDMNGEGQVQRLRSPSVQPEMKKRRTKRY